MRISERFDGVDEAVPRAIRVLENLHGAPTYQEAHGLRHPLAAYRVSLSTVAQRLLAVLNELMIPSAIGQVPTAITPPNEEHLLEATDHMLDGLMEHMDVCRSIVRCLFSPDDVRFRKASSKYRQSVETYRNHIGSVDNYIKHNQGRLRLVSFTWRGGSCHGYYVEGPIGSGVGPAEEIHGPEGTAFSFNRDVRFHVCNIFGVSDRLAAAICSADPRIDAAHSPAKVGDSSSDLTRVLGLAAGLPAVFFPDEVKKAVPLVQIDANVLTIEYPSTRVRPLGPPFASKITTSVKGDGVTRAFKLPYLKQQTR